MNKLFLFSIGSATILTIFIINFSINTSMVSLKSKSKYDEANESNWNDNGSNDATMNQTGMMMGSMMGMGQVITMPCMLMAPMTFGNQTMFGSMPCIINPGMMMDEQQPAMRGWLGNIIVVVIPPVIDAMTIVPSQKQIMMNQINPTGTMMTGVQQPSMMGFWSEILDIIEIITGPRIPPIIFVLS
jgi:hypothetical protein